MRGRTALWVAVTLLPGCDIGGGGGGGPSPIPLPQRPPFQRPPEIADPAARGKIHYRNLGCALCHGEAGAGGVANRNSETGGLITGLTKVREGYSRAEIAKRIREGVPTVGKKDPRGPTPPLRMPAYAAYLTGRGLDDLVSYLFSLYPGKASPAKDARTGAAGAGPAVPVGEDDWDKEDEEAGTKREPAPEAQDDWDREEP